MCYNLKYLACFAVGAAVVTAIPADGDNHGYCQLPFEARNKRFYTIYSPCVKLLKLVTGLMLVI